MSAREFQDWQRFMTEHPLPWELVDIHGAITAATLINVNRASTSPLVEPVDFLIVRERRPKPTKGGATLSIAQRMKAAAGG